MSGGRAPGAEVDHLEPFPEPSKRGRRLLWLFGTLLVLGLAAVGVALFVYQRQVDPAGPAGEEVTVTVPMGTTGQGVAEILEDTGVIESAEAFRLYLKVNPSPTFQAGEYTFRRKSSFPDVIATLNRGPEISFDRVTVPEGLTVEQVAARVGKLPGRSGDRFLELARSGTVRSRFQPPGSTSLEGLLFPETYFVEDKDDEQVILRRMVTTFDQRATALGYDRARELVGLSPYEAIVLASLVERETRFDDERPKVSRVIHNRRQRGQPLQVDATVIYALGRSADRNVRVLTKDLEVDSPYNTYRIKGLPPTPIAAPGPESLQAALDPEPGPWLFYVVTEKDGRHAFATTNEEHQANIRQAERNGAR